MIRILRHQVEGFSRLYENKNWTVAWKTAAPSNSREAVTKLERHNKTDEIFILLSGNAVMMEGNVEAGAVTKLAERRMEQGCIYLIPKGTWHNTWMEPGAVFAMVENADTSYENTDLVEIGKIARQEDVE